MPDASKRFFYEPVDRKDVDEGSSLVVTIGSVGMANHYCLDPFDPDGRSEVFVVFEGRYPDMRLLSVINQNHDDILSDLVEEQRRDLIREIGAFYRPPLTARTATG